MSRPKKLPFPISINKFARIFDLLHMDIWGPRPQPSIHGEKYFLTDDFSRHTWALLLNHKHEVAQHIKHFISFAENQFNCKVKAIRTHSGVQFLMHDFFKLKGIIHHTTCVETPQQNGLVERKHQHLLSMCRALMFQASLPKVFWSYVLSHAIFFY
jgi:transposase InsO family protein